MMPRYELVPNTRICRLRVALMFELREGVSVLSVEVMSEAVCELTSSVEISGTSLEYCLVIGET